MDVDIFFLVKKVVKKKEKIYWGSPRSRKLSRKFEKSDTKNTWNDKINLKVDSEPRVDAKN